MAGSLQLAVTRSSAGGGTTFRSCTCCAGQVESDQEVRLCAAAVGDHRQAHPLQGNGLRQQVLQLGHMGRLQDTGAGRSVLCECMCVCGSYLKQCSQCTLQAVVGCRRAVRERQQRTRKRRPLASSTACLMFWYVVRCPRFRITS